uniref:Secreted protein n=1 Tax=Macrostomum lignano TaxID=282301 RepID=A0A1I8FW36_9PLAT
MTVFGCCRLPAVAITHWLWWPRAPAVATATVAAYRAKCSPGARITTARWAAARPRLLRPRLGGLAARWPAAGRCESWPAVRLPLLPWTKSERCTPGASTAAASWAQAVAQISRCRSDSTTGPGEASEASAALAEAWPVWPVAPVTCWPCPPAAACSPGARTRTASWALGASRTRRHQRQSIFLLALGFKVGATMSLPIECWTSGRRTIAICPLLLSLRQMVLAAGRPTRPWCSPGATAGASPCPFPCRLDSLS